MKMNRAWIRLTILILVVMVALAGCGKSTGTSASDTSNGTEEMTGNKILIYTTLFPLYDFARQIGGQYAEVKSMIPVGAEPHDFEPSAKDMVELNKADLFVYNGAGFEAWVDKTVENINKDKTVVVNASEGLALLESHHHEDGDEEDHDHEQSSEESDHEDEAEEGHDHDHGEYDPHVWLDPMMAKEQANKILQALIQIDPEHKAEFQANYDQLAADLDSLDREYRDTINKAAVKELIVSHQAFSYLANRYGFEQIPVSGLSPSNEPSQKELMELIQVLKEHNLKYVAFDSLVESKVAQTVQREAGAEAVSLYTLENITSDQMKAGKSYIQLMKENLETLKKVFEVQ